MPNMKRAASRDLSPSSKRSRSSVGRYDESSDDEGRRSSRGGSPQSHRYARGDSVHHSERDDYARGSRSSVSSYKVLCVSNLHPKASDEMVRDALHREFKRFGDVTVKVAYDVDERVAYVYFRTCEEAKEGKRSKPRILFYDKPVIVEPLYEPRDYAVVTRGRSRSPLDYDRVYRPRSPMMEYDDRYDPHFDRGRPIISPHDYYGDSALMHQDDYGYSSYRSRGHGTHYFGPPNHRGGYKMYYGRGSHESKRDKFPNYLHHISPEDDSLATRTLFAGNLEINISEDELRRIFGRYGVVDDIDIKRPPPGTGNAYAFVRFQNLDMAHRAKIELSGQYIGKFQCKIGYGKAMPTCRVWVGGLGSWTSLTQLTQEFDRFGAIQKIEYEKGDTEAYILYETLDAAQAAVKEMRGFPLGGQDKRLRTDFADVASGSLYSSGGGEWGSREYEEYNSDYNYGRGRGRGKGWHERGRGGGNRSSGSYGDHDNVREYDSGENASNRSNHGSEHGDSKQAQPPASLIGCRSLADVARRTTANWQGILILKNSSFGTKMHLIEGDNEVSDLMKDTEEKNILRVTQRLRLDQSRIDDVSKRISAPSSATILLALPSTPSSESSLQTRPLRNLVAYLKQKEAAGVITLNATNKEDVDQFGAAGNKEGISQFGAVLYAFPPCNFSLELLQRAAPALTAETTKDDHLVIVIVKGSAA